MSYAFRKVTKQDIPTVLGWLAEPHVMEFWDNSQDHKDDIVNFANGRIEPSSYFDGMFDYWIGLKDQVPFSLIMTHEENEDTDPPAYLRPYMSDAGKTICLDFCIGNKDYFGKGLAAPTLQAFMGFYAHEEAPNTRHFLIDPLYHNPRAIHVYEKAGFKKEKDFVQEGGFFPGKPGVIMIKRHEQSHENNA